MSQLAQPPDHSIRMRYAVIWAVLVLLFVCSIAFNGVTSFVVGVVFAFFIAIIKALMVAAWFMHLNIERRWVWIMLGGGLAVVFIMWLGVAPDVMESAGQNWSKLPAVSAPK